MFRSNFQGGTLFEIFSGQGKDPVAKWKLSGGSTAVHKEYNKEVKGFVYCLEGSSQTVKMQMPESDKMSLGLIQRFLILQVFIPLGHNFSTELGITDGEHLKRRLHLSTVHKKLSATILHAKIPFVGLKYNTWSTICIDLVSLADDLFKGFLSLDCITLFANCKVRRIFTMKSLEKDMSCCGDTLMDAIPPSFRYPALLDQVTLVLNIENLQRSDPVKTEPFQFDDALDQTLTTRSTGYQRTRLQGASDTAAGFKTSELSPRTVISSSRKLQKSSLGGASVNDSTPHGASCKLQSRVPKKKVLSNQGPRKLPVSSPRKETVPSSETTLDAKFDLVKKTGIIGEDRISSPGQEKSEDRFLTSAAKSLPPREDACGSNPFKESSGAVSKPAESELCSSRPGSSPDLRAWHSGERNDGSEPQLTLPEEAFIFSSQPHSSKWGQGQGDQEKMNLADDPGESESARQYRAHLEGDFVGSESDEEEENIVFQSERINTTYSVTLENEDEPLPVPLGGDAKSPLEGHASAEQLPTHSGALLQSWSCRGAKPVEVGPTRCLSPNTADCKSTRKEPKVDASCSVSLSRSILQEVRMEDSIKDEVRGDDCDEDEELRMLATLKKEQEEDECQPLGLSASQIRQCNISVDMNIYNVSTRTSISTPVNQGHHYQKEMSPLLQSNPREWMDVLSPPIMPPSQQRRSGDSWNNPGSLVREEDGSLKEEKKSEEEFLNLLYDPCLNCYFDPETGKYYVLA